MNFPEPNEYAAYYSDYIKNIPTDANIIECLENGRDALQSLIIFIPEAKGNFSYAEGKWSIKEVLGHIADIERIMAYRHCVLQEVSQNHYLGLNRMIMYGKQILITDPFKVLPMNCYI